MKWLKSHDSIPNKLSIGWYDADIGEATVLASRQATGRWFAILGGGKDPVVVLAEMNNYRVPPRICVPASNADGRMGQVEFNYSGTLYDVGNGLTLIYE